MPARKAAVSIDSTFDDKREVERRGRGRGSSRGRPRENRFFSIANVAHDRAKSMRNERVVGDPAANRAGAHIELLRGRLLEVSIPETR